MVLPHPVHSEQRIMVVSLTYEENGNCLNWYLRPGEKAVLGNSPWCDFVLPPTDETSYISCTLHLEDVLLVEPIAQSELTFNNSIIDKAKLAKNDSFRINQYSVAVNFLGTCGRKQLCDELSASTEETSNTEQSKSITSKSLWFNYDSLPDVVSMSEEGKNLFLLSAHPIKAIDRLLTHELLEDAIRGLAGMLPLMSLLSWCTASLEASQLDLDSGKLGKLKRWLSEPHRISQQEMASMVVWSDNSNPLTHLLAAVSWVNPSDSSPRTWCPAATLPSVTSCVIASLQLATAKVKAMPFRKACIERGLALLSKELPETDLGGTS